MECLETFVKNNTHNCPLSIINSIYMKLGAKVFLTLTWYHGLLRGCADIIYIIIEKVILRCYGIMFVWTFKMLTVNHLFQPIFWHFQVSSVFTSVLPAKLSWCQSCFMFECPGKSFCISIATGFSNWFYRQFRKNQQFSCPCNTVFCRKSFGEIWSSFMKIVYR